MENRKKDIPVFLAGVTDEKCLLHIISKIRAAGADRINIDMNGRPKDGTVQINFAFWKYETDDADPFTASDYYEMGFKKIIMNH